MALEITQEIIDSFRDNKKAFADDTKWPDEIVRDALCEADAETGGRGWGLYVDICSNFKLRGMYYYAAHWLTSFYGTKGAEDTSAIDPAARLNISGKSVADESIQFRITAIQTTGDDWLSTTIYGTNFLRLRPRATMGARAL